VVGGAAGQKKTGLALALCRARGRDVGRVKGEGVSVDLARLPQGPRAKLIRGRRVLERCGAGGFGEDWQQVVVDAAAHTEGLSVSSGAGWDGMEWCRRQPSITPRPKGERAPLL
jgi:hypothetical protein